MRTLRALALLGLATVAILRIVVPAAAASPAFVPVNAVIDSIRFDGNVPADKQNVILTRIGFRVGDTLNVEARQRIGRELNNGEKINGPGLTFRYKPGARIGTVTLVISSDC